MASSRGPSGPRDQIRAPYNSCVGGFFSTRASWEAPSLARVTLNTRFVMRWHQLGCCQHSYSAHGKCIKNSVNDMHAYFLLSSFPPRSLSPFCLQRPSYLTTPTSLQIWLWVSSCQKAKHKSFPPSYRKREPMPKPTNQVQSNTLLT